MNLKAFHAMAKPTSATWNRDCARCFFLSREQTDPSSTVSIPEERAMESCIRPSGERGLNYVCPGLHAWFSHALDLC